MQKIIILLLLDLIKPTEENLVADTNKAPSFAYDVPMCYVCIGCIWSPKTLKTLFS